MKEEKINLFNKLVTLRDAFFLSISILIFSILRVPSLIEPYWYGDEGIYQVIGMALNRGRVLYEGIWDNKPPLLYIIYAIFDGDLFYVRLASLVVGILSVVIFFLLAKKLFKQKPSIYLSTLIFTVLFAIPTLEGNIANAENFMLLPIISAFYLFVASPSKNKNIVFITAGVLLSIAFLIKIVAVFDLAALIFSILTFAFYEKISFGKDLVKHVKNISLLCISFIAPILLTGIYFFLEGAFADFTRAVFFQNVGYVGYGNSFLFPMGFMFLKISILVFALILIFIFRKKIGVSGVVILIWLAFSVFNAFFSQRPYTHYVLVMLPSFALLVGYIIDNKKLLKVTIPLLILVLFVVNIVFHPRFAKSVAYYQNYIEFIVGIKSVDNYRAFFDGRTPRDYAIAEFIKTKTAPNENVFLWSDSGQIYALAGKFPPGRYIVAYHITFYPEGIEETKKAIDNNNPKYIIQTKDTHQINNFIDNYEIRYKMDGVNIYERQF